MSVFFIAQYLKDADFVSGFDKDTFTQEVIDSGFLSGIFLGITDNKIIDTSTGLNENDPNGVQVWTSVALTTQQQLDLDNLVQAHPTLPAPPIPPPGSEDGSLHARTHYPDGSDPIPLMGVAGATVDGLFGWVKPPPAGTTAGDLVFTSGMTWASQSGGEGKMSSSLFFSGKPFGGAKEASLDGFPGFKIKKGGSGTGKGVSFAHKVPGDANLSVDPKVSFDVFQYNNDSDPLNDTVVFGIAIKYLADGEIIGNPVDETLTLELTFLLDTSQNANDGQKISGSFNLNKVLIENDDTIFGSIVRLGNDPNDTFDDYVLFSAYGSIEFGK